MNAKPKVSVVVPIYKVEKYLRQCVDSILAQTLREIEVILVDDGSPDACPAICDEYAARDARVRVIHQPNGGYGKAVNAGIAAATAPYIGIIESDDWIELSMYEKLYNRASEIGAHAVKCGHYSYNSALAPEYQNTPWVFEKINIYNAPEGAFYPTEWPEVFLFHTGPWSWLYQTDLLRSIPFIESAGAAYQDIPFMYEMLAKQPRIAVVKELLIHYREEENSGSSSGRNDAGLMRMADMSLKALHVLNQYELLNTLKEEFAFQVFNTHVANIEKIQPQYQQEYFNKVHAIFQELNTRCPLSFKYFQEKHLGKVRLLIEGGDVSGLFKKWRLSFKKGRPCTELPAFIIRRLPVRLVYDNNYFNDAYQGIPIGGYNRLTEALLEGIECRVNEDFFDWESVADKIVFTGKIDEFYGYRFGKLEYRTVTFEHEELDTPKHQGCAVVNYTERHIPYTRIIEHKHFEDFGDDVYSKPVTVISREYSTEWTEGSEPFYPVNDEANSVLYQQYKALADAESNVIFGGRLAEYKYYDMAPDIEQALKHFI